MPRLSFSKAILMSPDWIKMREMISFYEKIWDDYSLWWDTNSDFRKVFKFLGDEWGEEELVRFSMETFVSPYIKSTDTVLEIGPGGGRYTAYVAPFVNRLVCLDVSHLMLERVKRRFAAFPGLLYVKGNGHDLSKITTGAIDFVFAFNVFVQLEFEDLFNYLQEIRRILRPGGKAALHYAVISSDDGWNYFLENYRTWMACREVRGRFCEMTLQKMELLVERLGLGLIYNQHVSRDAVVIIEKPDPSKAVPAPAPDAFPSTCLRRNYRHFDRYLDELARDVYNESPTQHHKEAAQDVVDGMLAGLHIETVLELGSGSGPCLDRLASSGKKTYGVSLGTEKCAHPVLHADMHFTNMPPEQYDLVIARHVLEHSPMPLLLLMEIHRLSRRYALVVVPCDDPVWVNWSNHYSVFSKLLWRRLINRAGWEVVKEQDAYFDNDAISVEWRFLLEKGGQACRA